MNPKPVSAWMSQREAITSLCVSETKLRRMAKEGRIGTLSVPGVTKTSYSRADVMALVEAGSRPATMPAERRTAATV